MTPSVNIDSGSLLLCYSPSCWAEGEEIDISPARYQRSILPRAKQISSVSFLPSLSDCLYTTSKLKNNSKKNNTHTHDYIDPHVSDSLKFMEDVFEWIDSVGEDMFDELVVSSRLECISSRPGMVNVPD